MSKAIVPRRLIIYGAQGKVRGVIENRVLRKEICGRIHLLRKPPAIALDARMYDTNRNGRVYNCSPPAGSPRFARGTAWGAWVRFPLRAGGTLRRGSSISLVLVNCVSAIGIIPTEPPEFTIAPLL